MEPTHYTSELDPSSVLGFGSALTLLDSAADAGRLLTGALRSMGLSDLQAVVLTGPVGKDGQVVGSIGTRALPSAVVQELRALPTALSIDDGDSSRLARKQVEVTSDAWPALAEESIRHLSVVRLGTVDHDFGVVVAGRRGDTTHTPMQRSCLQMMVAQLSMALHRIQLDRKRAENEEALRKSETRYRALYENAPVAYLSTTGNGEIRMANQRAADLMATTTDDLEGRTLTSFCSEKDEAQATERRLAECVQDGTQIDEVVEICRADGEQRWVNMSIQPFDAAGGVECLVMMVDVTERVRMEQALRDTRDALEERVEARTAELEAANEQLREQTERLATLRNVDQAILEAESPEEIASEAIRRVRRIVPFRRASVVVLDRDAEQGIVLATCEESVPKSGTTLSFDDLYLSDSLWAGQT